MTYLPSFANAMRAIVLAALIGGPLGLLAVTGADNNQVGNGAGLVLFVTLQRQAMS